MAARTTVGLSNPHTRIFTAILMVFLMFFMIAMVKALVPRYRYDQLMRLGWKVFLPTSLAAVALMAGFVVYSNAGA